MVKNACRMCSTNILVLSTNNITAFWRWRCRSRRGFWEYQNGSPKYNLALSQVFRDYSVLFTLYNTGELFCNWMDTNGFKVRTENNCFVVICSRCRQNLKFGDFTSLFCGVRQKMHGNSCYTCSTMIFPFLTNDVLALWRCCSRSRSSRLCLNSLLF